MGDEREFDQLNVERTQHGVQFTFSQQGSTKTILVRPGAFEVGDRITLSNVSGFIRDAAISMHADRVTAAEVEKANENPTAFYEGAGEIIDQWICRNFVSRMKWMEENTYTGEDGATYCKTPPFKTFLKKSVDT